MGWRRRARRSRRSLPICTAACAACCADTTNPSRSLRPSAAGPDGNFDENEAFVLDNIAKVAEGQRQAGCHFDFYSVDFWVDYHGDLKRFDPVRFPNGLTKIRAELAKLGTAPGLWIDSSWEAGRSAAIRRCADAELRPEESHPESAAGLLPRHGADQVDVYRGLPLPRPRKRRAAAEVRQSADICKNPNHAHLPGIYSTEPIENAAIEFLRAWTRNVPMFSSCSIGVTVRRGGCCTATRCLNRASTARRPPPATCRRPMPATASPSGSTRRNGTPRTS